MAESPKPHCPKQVFTLTKPNFKNVLPKVGQALARNNSSAYNYLPDSVGEFPAYEALTERMVAAGLSSAKFYPLTFGIATLYIGVK